MPKSRQEEFHTEPGTNVPELKVDSLKFGIAFALILTAVQRLVGLARSVLLCRLLPEEQLGQWSLTLSYLMLIAPLAVLGLPGSFSRYVEHFRRRGQLRMFLFRIAAISICTTILFSVVLVLFSEGIAHWLFRDQSQYRLVAIMAYGLILVVAFNFVSSLMESLRQIRLATMMRFINSISFAALAIGMLFVWHHGTEAVAIGFAVSCLIGLIPAAWFLWRHWNVIGESRQPLQAASMWSRVAPFAAWLWVINLMSNLFELADRHMLLHLAPTGVREAQALVGQYHSGRVIPLMLVGVAAMLAGILMPYMTARWERGEKQKVSEQLRWTLKLTGLGFTLIGLLILLCAPILFNHILQGKYNAGWAVLPLTLVYCIWYSLLTVGQDYLWCREKGKWACLVLAMGLAANIALNALLIPRFGLSGAVWATATSNIASVFTLYLVNRRFGWSPDRGVWMVAAVPLILLMPLHTAAIVFLVVSWCAIEYQWIFDENEVVEIRRTVHNAWRWLKMRLAKGFRRATA